MIRVGFIGCGGIAHEYRDRLLKRTDRARFAAVCDLDQSRAAAFAEAAGATVHGDWAAMLAAAELDAVFDNRPPFARDDALAAAARAGLAVFATKPLALDLEVPRRSLAAIEQAGVVSSVGYMFRYSGIVDAALHLLDGRPPTVVVGHVYGGMPGGWTAQNARSGGQIVEQSTHLFDLARLFCGEVDHVLARGHSGAHSDIDFADSTAVTLAFESGAVGAIVSTTAVRQFDWRFTVIARDLHLDLTFDAWTIRGVVDGRHIDEHRPDRTGYQEQIDAFLGAIERGDPAAVRSRYADGCRTLSLTLAADRALRSDEAERPEPI